jgi:hypothetical protein
MNIGLLGLLFISAVIAAFVALETRNPSFVLQKPETRPLPIAATADTETGRSVRIILDSPYRR